MASSVDIAQLNIKITDNADKSSEKILNLAQALEMLKNSAKDTGLKTVSSELTSLKGADLSGLSRLNKALSKALTPAKALAEAMREISKANAAINKGVSATAKATSKVQETVDGTVRSSAPGSNYSGTTAGGNQSVVQTAKSFAQAQAILDQIDLKGSLEGWVAETKRAVDASNRFTNSIKAIGKFGKEVFSHALPTGLSRTIAQFGRLMKMRILRTIVKNLLAGFTEGLQNCYYWAKATGDQFAHSMDTIATSLNYAKNSIGAAFSSVLNIIAPIIDKVVDWLVVGINYINMFFAALSGATTYTKAKKNIVEFGTAAQGAIGGAAGAVKELKEELSVLDFDELHQLQAQQEPSGGGGGGGGGGTPGTDYADMFEKAEIEGWLSDNFKDILDTVKAIGMGILGWKLADAFSNSIKQLTGLQKFGVALMFTGFTLEAMGAYDLGYEGANLANILKTAIGAALGVTGSLLTFGVNALGWTIGLSAALIIGVTAYITGKRQKQMDDVFENLKDKSVTYNVSVNGLDTAREKLSDVNDLMARVRDNTLEANEELKKIAIGQSLLDKIGEFEGKVGLSASEMAELNGLTEAYNQLNLTDAVKWWQDVNGVVHTNVDEIQNAIDKYKEYAKIKAIEDLTTTAYTNQAEAEATMTQTQPVIDELKNKIIVLQSQLDAYRKASGYGGNENWQPGDNVENPAFGSDKRITTWETLINQLYEQYKGNVDVMEGAQNAYDTSQRQIDTYTDMYANAVTNIVAEDVVPSEATESVEEFKKTLDDLTPTEMRQYAAQLAMRNGYADLVPVIKQGGEEGKRATEQLIGMFGEFNKGASVVNDSTDRNKTYTGSLKLMGDESKKTSSTIVSALSGITKGVDMSVMGQTMANNFTNAFVNVGKTVTNGIEKDMNGIGSGMQYSTIMSNINKGLTNAQKNVPFSNIGVTIGGNMQSGTVSGYNSTTVMNSYLSGLTDKQKTTLFSVVGKAMGIDMQNGAYDGFSAYYIINSYLSGLTDKQKNALFSAVGAAMGDDMEGGAWNSFSTWYIISEYLKGLTNAVGNMSFSSIGTTIAGDIKWGIQNSLNGQTINVQTSVGGINSTTKGTMWVNMTAAEGALGINSGTVFLAGEAGAEAVGTINGKTGVANRDQIASAIAMALQPMLSGGGTTTTNVNVNMDSRTVARASLKGQRAMNRQYNITATA